MKSTIINFKFNNLTDLLQTFDSEEKCKKFLEQQRWQDKITCPHCGHDKAYRTNAGFKCASNKCYKKFTVTVGTVFENSNIKLQKWFVAIYLFTAHKKGVSSCQLAKDLGIGQKAAWFMLHRIREMFTVKADTPPLSGTIEMDESYFGGKRCNKHKHVREKLKEQGEGYVLMSPVFGMIQRGGYLILKATGGNKTDKHILQPIIADSVEVGSTVITDGFAAYRQLKGPYTHEVINHAQDEWSRGNFNTNSIEGAFSQMKRGVYGIYHHISPKHLQRYCDEFAFRFNKRKITDDTRFSLSLTQVNGRLTYKQLIAKDESSKDNNNPKV